MKEFSMNVRMTLPKTPHLTKFVLFFIHIENSMSQSTLNYFNNVIDFDAELKFEKLKDDDKEKKLAIVKFEQYKKLAEINKQFEELDKDLSAEFKLNALMPKIMDYHVRGILSIASQIKLADENVGQFLEYETKEKPKASLELFDGNLKSYLKSDPLKIKIFNSVFPHGVHESVKDKDSPSGVDLIYLQKVGAYFLPVLKMMCEGEDLTAVNKMIKSTALDEVVASAKTQKKQLTKDAAVVNIDEYLRIDRLQGTTQQEKDEKAKMRIEIRALSKELQDWVAKCISEMNSAQRLWKVLSAGFDKEKETDKSFGKDSVTKLYKKFDEFVKKASSLADEKVSSNADLIKYARKIIDFGDELIGKDKGIVLLTEAKANVKALLPKSIAKAFMEGKELDKEIVDKLFELKGDFSITKNLVKLANFKTMPMNMRIALGIYLSNEFYKEVCKATANKSWTKKTIYVDFDQQE